MNTNTTDATKPVMGVLIGADEQDFGAAMSHMVAHSFGNEHELRCTVKPDGREIRKAVSLYEFELVILLVNSMRSDGRVEDRFEKALDLIRELRMTTHAAVIVGTSHRPMGFQTQAEQAGADGLLDVPFTVAAMKETIENAFEGRRIRVEAEMKAAEARLKRDAMRPRVVLLDDESIVMGFVAQVVWSCWRHATIIACTDSHAVWEELQRTPPNLFITDLVHGGIDGWQLLARLAEQQAKYPIVVLSGNLPEREADARAAAGPGLRVNYWPKPINRDEFAEGIEGLLD